MNFYDILEDNQSILQDYAQRLVEREVYHSCSIMMRDLCDVDGFFDNNIDLFVRIDEESEENIEPLEHWIISDWLANHLADYDEMTGKLFDFNIWGRTCSGQAMYLDLVMQKIAWTVWKDDILREVEKRKVEGAV